MRVKVGFQPYYYRIRSKLTLFDQLAMITVLLRSGSTVYTNYCMGSWSPLLAWTSLTDQGIGSMHVSLPPHPPQLLD